MAGYYLNYMGAYVLAILFSEAARMGSVTNDNISLESR